jgi:hypothetical protein
VGAEFNVRTLQYTPAEIEKSAKGKNKREYILWEQYFINLQLNMFEWVGLPETVNERYLEWVLLNDAEALFFYDNQYGFLALPTFGGSNLNVYYEPTTRRAQGNNYAKEFPIDECVLIRDNARSFPAIQYIRVYAEKVSDSGRTIDVYSKTMKRPFGIYCDKDDTLTVKTLYDKVSDNEVIVVGDKRLADLNNKLAPNPMDGNSLTALWRNHHELLDEYLTLFGINNANTEKRERLITSEVESNNQLIQLNMDLRLDWRKRACEEINKMFALNISCELRHDYIEEQEKEDKTNAKNNDDSGNSGRE